MLYNYTSPPAHLRKTKLKAKQNSNEGIYIGKKAFIKNWNKLDTLINSVGFKQRKR